MTQNVLKRVFVQGQLLAFNLYFNTKMSLFLFKSVTCRPNNESAKFLCSKTECNDDDHVNGCVKIYSSIHECCSTSIVCGMHEILKIKIFYVS